MTRGAEESSRQSGAPTAMSARPTDPADRAARRRGVGWGRLVVLFLVLMGAALWTPLRMWRASQWWTDDGVRYRAVTLSFNYLDFGAVRRGLGGTLVRWLGVVPLEGLAIFHVAATVLASAAFCVLLARRSLERGSFALAASGLIVLALFWGNDAGRTDPMVAALLTVAALTWWRWPILAALSLVAALGFHEMAAVYGVPLIAALWYERQRAAPDGTPQASVASRRAALFLFAVAIGLQVAIDRLPHAPPAAIAAWVWQHFSVTTQTEWALYYYLAGTRGMAEAMCQNWRLDDGFGLHLLAGLAVTAGTVLVFNRFRSGGWLAPMLAGMIPFAFLGAISLDLARWSAFSAFTAGVVCLARPETREPAQEGRLRGWQVALLGALVIACTPRFAPGVQFPGYSPAPLIEQLVALWSPRHSPAVEVGLDRCDPTWREVLHPRRTEGQ